MTIEGYLRELRRHLKVGPLAKRRILSEVEAHLREAAEEGGDEQAAVARFGAPSDLASGLGRRSGVRVPRAIASIAAAAGAAAALAIAFGANGVRVVPSATVRAACGGQNASAACLLRNELANGADAPFHIVRRSFTESASTDGSASAKVTLVVLDRHDNAVAHITCRSNTRSGYVSANDLASSVEPRLALGVPPPNCASTD
jgi:HAAS